MAVHIISRKQYAPGYQVRLPKGTRFIGRVGSADVYENTRRGTRFEIYVDSNGIVNVVEFTGSTCGCGE